MQNFLHVLLQSCFSSSMSQSNPGTWLSHQHCRMHGLGLVLHTGLYIYSTNAGCAESCH